MPDNTPAAAAASTEPNQPAAPSSPPPDPQLAAVEALRVRLGLPKPTGSTGSVPSAKSSSPPPASSAEPTQSSPPAQPASSAAASGEEAALRALAEEQLRLSRERRQLETERRERAAAEQAATKRLARLDAIEAAQAAGDRLALLRALHDNNLPDGELGAWGQEIAVAMSGEARPLTPAEIEAAVERKIVAREAAAKAEQDKADADAAAVRDETNQRYLGALTSALKADPKKYPGINHFGVDATRVIKLVEDSFNEFKGERVLSVQEVLDRLEADLRSGFEAAYGTPQPTATTAPAPGATQPALSAVVTPPATQPPAKSLREIDDEARREILKKAWELERARRAAKAAT